MAEDFHYRRRPPHWRQDNAAYFVTWRLMPHQPELSAPERDGIVEALTAFDGARYVLLAYVVMNDHVHVVLSELKTYSLDQIVHSWKSFTANRLQRRHGRVGRLWQDEYFDRIVRDESEFWQKVDYILSNPAKRWPDLASYKWVWARVEEK